MIVLPLELTNTYITVSTSQNGDLLQDMKHLYQTSKLLTKAIMSKTFKQKYF